MKDAFLKVCEFERRVGKELSCNGPSAPSYETINLRMRLIKEEYEELMEALRAAAHHRACGQTVTEEMLADIADGSADLQFVCMGTDHAFGIDGPAVMAEVCRANLSKFDGEHWYDDTGKLRKSPNFVPPDVIGVIKHQRSLRAIYQNDLDKNQETQG